MFTLNISYLSSNLSFSISASINNLQYIIMIL